MGVVVRNLVLVQRASNSLSDDVKERVHELFGEIVQILARIDPTGPSLQRYRVERLAKVVDEIETILGPAFDDVARITTDAVVRLGKHQADTAAVHLKALLGAGAEGSVEVVKVTIPQLRAIVREDPIVGAPLKDWWANQKQRTRFALRRELQLGLTNAEPIGDMVRRIRGRFAGYQRVGGQRVPRYVGGVLGTTSREAEALARTAANHVANTAALEVFRGNDDIVSHVEWTSALDGRVCVQCGSLDGKRWAMDDPGLRRPPAHPNDRCILVPVVDWKGMGLEPPPDGTRATALDPETGRPGQVSSEMRYQSWLKSQPASVQAEILGPSRAKLFRGGRVSLSELVRTDGTRVRLEDLAA